MVSKEEDENEELSDFKEKCETMKKGKGSYSDKKDVYIDRGIQGKQFVRQIDGNVHFYKGLQFSDITKFRKALVDFVFKRVLT